MLTHTAAIARTITFARALTARGFLGRLSQRGLTIRCDAQRRAVALTAYTDQGPTAAAQLEVPVDDLRRLARVLLDLADATDRDQGLRVAPITITQLAAA